MEVVRPSVPPKEWNLSPSVDNKSENKENKKRMGVKKLQSRQDISIAQLITTPQTMDEESEISQHSTPGDKAEMEERRKYAYYTIDIHDGKGTPLLKIALINQLIHSFINSFIDLLILIDRCLCQIA